MRHLIVLLAVVVAVLGALACGVSCKHLDDDKTIMDNLDADLPPIQIVPTNMLGTASKRPANLDAVAFPDPKLAKPKQEDLDNAPPIIVEIKKPLGSASRAALVSGLIIGISVSSALSSLLLV